MRPYRAWAPVILGALLAGADARADRIGDDDYPGEHVAIVVRKMQPGAELGAVVGRSPSPEYPMGTAIIAWSHVRNGPMLTEWDIARRRVVRNATIGWTPAGVFIARWGNRLAVVSYAYQTKMGEIGWALLDADDWRTLATGSLGPGMRPVVAVDGSFMAVYYEDEMVWRPWNGRPSPVYSHVAMLDHSGHVAATWRVPQEGEGSWHANMALLGSDVYLFERRDGRPSQLVKLNPSRPGQRSVTPYEGRAVVAHDGRLFVYGANVLELAPDLQVVRRIHDEVVPGSIASDGSVVSCDEWVRSPSFQVWAVFQTAHSWCHTAFWVGDTPLLLTTIAEPGTVAWLSWLDADVAHRDGTIGLRGGHPPAIVVEEGPAFRATPGANSAPRAGEPREGDAGASGTPPPSRNANPP